MRRFVSRFGIVLFWKGNRYDSILGWNNCKLQNRKKGKYPDEGTFHVKLASLDNGLFKRDSAKGNALNKERIGMTGMFEENNFKIGVHFIAWVQKGSMDWKRNVGHRVEGKTGYATSAIIVCKERNVLNYVKYRVLFKMCYVNLPLLILYCSQRKVRVPWGY